MLNEPLQRCLRLVFVRASQGPRMARYKQCGTEATTNFFATHHVFDFFKTKASRHTLSGDFEAAVVL
jgi:hypothetical protein